MMRETATACGAQQRETQASAIRGAISGNVGFARELAERGERLADALVGAVPECASEGSVMPPIDGFLAELRFSEDVMNAMLRRISDALGRMEKELG